jgi:hypothetical protein
MSVKEDVDIVQEYLLLLEQQRTSMIEQCRRDIRARVRATMDAMTPDEWTALFEALTCELRSIEAEAERRRREFN